MKTPFAWQSFMQVMHFDDRESKQNQNEFVSSDKGTIVVFLTDLTALSENGVSFLSTLSIFIQNSAILPGNAL